MQIELFTRPGCQLCVGARAVLKRVCAERGLNWSEINVDDDAELRAKYGEFVPVLVVGGEQVAQWRIDAQILSAALDGDDTTKRARRRWFRR